MKKSRGKTAVSKSAPVIKSGKTSVAKVTSATVRTLERAGSWESAKIAREIVEK